MRWEETRAAASKTAMVRQRSGVSALVDCVADSSAPLVDKLGPTVCVCARARCKCSVSQRGGSRNHLCVFGCCRVSASVAWGAKPLARLVRGLGSSVRVLQMFQKPEQQLNRRGVVGCRLCSLG